MKCMWSIPAFPLDSRARRARSPSSILKTTGGNHHSRPQAAVALALDATGARAYVANSGSNSISVLDLKTVARLPSSAPARDRSRFASLRTAKPRSRQSRWQLRQPDRSGYRPGAGGLCRVSRAGDVVILPDSSKAFAACSGATRSWSLR